MITAHDYPYRQTQASLCRRGSGHRFARWASGWTVSELRETKDEEPEIQRIFLTGGAAMLRWDGVFATVGQLGSFNNASLAQDAEVLGDVVLGDGQALREVVHCKRLLQKRLYYAEA